MAETLDHLFIPAAGGPVDNPPIVRIAVEGTPSDWAALSTLAGLVPGMSRLGNELSLVQPAAAIAASV